MNYLFKYNKYDLPLIFKNRNFTIEFEITDNNDLPIDIGGFTISSSVRTEYNNTSELICNFNVEKNLSTPTISKFSLSLPASISASISQTYGYYDIKVEEISGADAQTYVWGQVNFQGTPT